MNTLWSWERAADVTPLLFDSFVSVTLPATILGTLLAAALGLVIAVLRRVAPAAVARPLRWLTEFIRMTPLVVQLTFAYFLLTDLSGLTIGIGVLGIHYATYMAEVYRAGLDSVPKGQWEAATALSLSPRRTWTAVVIPQALRATAPALGNYGISMFKETPFLFAISVVEMVTRAQQYGARHFEYTEAITLAGVIFLAASYPTSLLVRRLEVRLAY
jgi:polar amino acid transport system permease protein